MSRATTSTRSSGGERHTAQTLAPMTAPLFTSFDDAWDWFTAGGELEPIAKRRERFTHGRAQFLSFQAPVNDASALALVADVIDRLRDVGGVIPMLDEQLHISIRGAGFQVLRSRGEDELTREDVGRAGEAASRALRGARTIEAAIGPVNVFPDALIL
jgi:hypothetical protein